MSHTEDVTSVGTVRLIVVVELLRVDLIKPSKEAMLATEVDRFLFFGDWGSFRTYLREIYRPETTSGAEIRGGLAREKREKNKTYQGDVVGRKEAGIVITSDASALIAGEHEDGPRYPSEKSTISDTADSSGGGLVVVPYETPTQHMATEFIRKIISLWGEGIPLSFAPPERPIRLTWQSYTLYYKHY